MHPITANRRFFLPATTHFKPIEKEQKEIWQCKSFKTNKYTQSAQV